MRAVQCTAVCVVLWLVRVRAMCPLGCKCTTDERHIVRCDGVPLTDVPSLLDPRTKTLSLSNCSLIRLDPDVMELYPDLEFLDLSENGLERLDLGIFRYQSKLRVLRLHGNGLSLVQKGSFTGLVQLQLLDISANTIIGIEPSSLQDLHELVQLNLSENQLSMIPADSLSGLSKLKKLDLSFNNFSNIDQKTLSDIPQLEALILQSNHISEIEEESFLSHESLRHLDLGSNQIASIPEYSLRGLGTLQYLNLSNNILRQTSSMSLQSLESLRELDLSSNDFEEFEVSSFQGLPQLQTLTLSHLHQLRVIEAHAFSNLPALQSVNLSSCPQLEMIDGDAFGSIEHLHSLDLSKCKLDRIPPNLVEWSRLQSLDLSNNPLHCNCEQLSFLPDLARSFNLSELMCGTPEDFSLQLLTEMSSSCATMTSTDLAVSIVISLLAVISALLLIGFLIRRRLRSHCSGSETKSGAPLYDRSYLVSSTGYDKTDMLSDSTVYSAGNREKARASPPKLINLTEDENDLYSTMLTPDGYVPRFYTIPTHLYGQPPNYCPIPPATATIPIAPALNTREDPLRDECNFKIISEYPVPITEL